MPSFDVVSEVDKHELTNAVDQASRELENRFDFRGVEASFSLEDSIINLEAPSDFQLKQMMDILRGKLAARKIDLKAIDEKEPEISLGRARQTVAMKQGIEKTEAKQLIKALKEAFKISQSMEPDPELDLQGLLEPEFGNHSFRRFADWVACMTKEETGVSKELIDAFFGWALKELLRDMQLHYAGKDRPRRMELAKVTMMI